ncbi:AI-2E family transporter [Propionicimonas sp.]|uniref:AI-2E family transporter n=1 Tax=Propionicimonas sp. TaxID=1955623 RepID=UPI00180158DE|nr:AI-2E family transporter [Propionicimonas sp.]MBU3977325.1 AI-2E family transporter [Actinomycetota bacterium]MBA3021250.1 AI-2E family transporter [Propionicimonas sp.]MBU3985835.1 AI-2E family transporter [Actinomycetota bacterium]MBU4008620.1 AI-2E family transporter [Actinomycetota bacterium]MBU4066230.1 AI-2E family transporter [Actinomycetota bacterium]
MTRSETPDASAPTEAEQPKSPDSEEVLTDVVAAAAEPARPRSLKVLADFKNPFSWGFVATIGVLLALALGGALASLSTVLVWMGIALFIALALDPMVKWLEGRGLARGISIALVFLGFALVLGGLLALVVPTAVRQISLFAASVPTYLTDLQNAPWFQSLIAATGQSDWYSTLLTQARTWLSDPANLLALGGGALTVGTGLVNWASGSFVVLVLTLYFLASLRTMKAALVRLAPAYSRPQLASFADRMTDSVGNYVSGMAILATCNALFSFIVLSLLGVPFAALLAFAALILTMIPMIGSPVFWVLATVVSLFTSWWAALIFTIAYNVYIQIEAYVMTPRVMNKAVNIPGLLVVIGALVGGTLFGLLGALVAVPVTASLLMVVQEVFLPKQDAKTVSPN